MNWGGMLAGGIAGGAQAADQIATGQIEKQAKLDYAKQISDMEIEKQRRIDEYMNSEARQSQLRTNASAATLSQAEATRAGEMAGANNPEYQGMLDKQNTDKSRRAVESANATSAGTRDTRMADAAAMSDASTKAEIAAAKAKGGDAEYLKSQAAIALADPRIAAQIAASRASAASAYASAAHSNASTEGVKLANADKKRLGDLYDELTATLYDTDLKDDERAKTMAKINTQIVAIKAKNGQGTGRDPELDTQTVVEKKTDEKGNETTTTRKEVRRPGQGGGDKAPYPDGTELRGKDGKVYVVQGGAPVLKQAEAKTTRSPSAAAPAAEPPSPPDSQEAVSLDAARAAARDAQAVFGRFGSAQRQRDPEGFARAQAEMSRAMAVLQEAEQAYRGTVSGGMLPGFKYPAP